MYQNLWDTANQYQGQVYTVNAYLKKKTIKTLRQPNIIT